MTNSSVVKVVSTTSKKQTAYRAEIDGLRTLAIVAVIINHFNKDLLPGGYFGVDIFFVISGYFTTASLAKRKYDSFRDFILNFYTRRIKRLIPALIFCVVLTSIIACLFDPSPDTSIRTGIASLFGISNIYLFRQATDYFGQSAEINFFTQTWSLGIEGQFYLFFPLITWFVGFSRETLKGGRNLFIFICVLSFLSLIYSIYLDRINPSAAYFLIFSRFWEVGIGCLLFLLLKKLPNLNRTLCRFPPLIFISLTITCFFAPLHLRVPITIVVVILTLFLLASLRPNTYAYKILTLQPILFIGMISYSLYLWHWSVLVVSRLTIGIHWWSIPIQLMLMGLMSVISYKYIETPLRQQRWFLDKWIEMVFALLCSFLLSLGLFFLLNNYAGSIYLGEEQKPLFSNEPSEIITKASSNPDFANFLETSKQKVYECNMTPQYLTGTHYRPAPVVDSSFIDKCLKTSKQKIVVIGDSFAGILADHIAYVAWQLGYDFSSIFGFGCPYPLDVRNNLPLRASSHCDINPEMLKEELAKNLKIGDILIFRAYFSKDQYIRLSEEMDETALTFYDDEIRELYKITQKNNASFLLIGSNTTALLPSGCNNRQWFNYFSRVNKGCTKVDMTLSPVNKFTVAHNRHLDQHFEKNETYKIPVINPLNYFCDKSQRFCSVNEPETNLMSDPYHLSNLGIDRLYEVIFSKLQLLASN